MRLFLQILLFLFTWFSSSALPIAIGTAPKIIIPTHTPIFQKTENASQSVKAKISLEIPKAFGIARSSIDKLQKQNSSFHQNTFLLSSYLEGVDWCAFVYQKAANSKSVVEGIQTGIDIVSLAIPGAQTCTALKMLNYLDKASSIASLSGSYLQDDYPDLANVLNITSSILAITDLSANGVDILLKANTNPSAAIDIISESEDVLDATAHIEHVEVLLDRITAPSPDPQVLAVLNSSNPKTKDFLVDILEAEKHSAKGADRMDIVNKIDEAIEVVSEAGNNLDELLETVKNSCNADELAELAQDATSFNLAKTQPQQFINGKNFERGIGNLIDNGDQAFLNQITNHSNVNLSQFTSIKQLQINLPNGGYMIADNAWVKQINVGGQVQFEVVLNECKLSSAAPWTTRQTELINSLNGGNINFTTRSAKAEITSIIPQNSTIKIKSLIKTEGAGSGYVVTKIF